MTSPEPYADVEVAVMDWVVAEFPERVAATSVATESPADLQLRLPFVTVARVGGDDDGVTDFALVEVEVFGPSRPVAYALAEDIRARLLTAPHRVGSVILDRVRTRIAPRRLPWADENIRRVSATYRISARR